MEHNDAETYERLIALVQAHAHQEFIYAAPDCPEVYFFSGLQSPSRHYFDTAEDPIGQSERSLETIDRLHVNVVAIHREAQFSGQMAPDLLAGLYERYPHSADLGRFEVRWKD